MSKIIISPSILSADFANLERDIKKVENAGATWLHIDVMDGHFVPNITIGVPVVKSIKKITNLPLDVHLMIENPDKYIKPFAEAGANILTFHYEACPDNIQNVIGMIKSFGIKAGLSIKPKTKPEEIIEYLPLLEMVLIMTVEPGFGGQAYIPESTDKIRALRKMLNDRGLTTDIEVDGGIKKDNLEMVLDAGANVIVAGSAIFKDDIEKNTRDFMEILKKRQA